MSTENTHTTYRTPKMGFRNAARAPAFMLPIFKSPIFLYRIGLGWIMGTRFMLLTHVGRRSGKIYRTVLAVLDFDPKTKEIKTISAWSHSDWFHNIQASPALSVETEFTRYTPVHNALSAEQIATLFEDYRKKHPIFTRIICQIPGWKWDSSHEEFVELAKTLRGVAFRPRAGQIDNSRSFNRWRYQ